MSERAWTDPAPGVLRWRQRRWWHWLVSQLYTLGVISSNVSSGHPDGWIVWGLGWRGKRPYILGIERERWGHPWHRVRRGHWPNNVGIGICGFCAPWPCCGATGYDHAEGCDEE